MFIVLNISQYTNMNNNMRNFYISIVSQIKKAEANKKIIYSNSGKYPHVK